MNILALDLSLTSTGVAASWSNRPTTLSGPHLRGLERLVAIREAVQSFAQDGPADVAVLEGYSFNSKNTQAQSTGELGGVVKVMLYELSIPIAIVPPAVLKKYATGKGNAPKDAVFAEAIRRFEESEAVASPRLVGTKDEADALWLLAMALDHYDEPIVPMPKVNREALEKVEWPKV